MTKHAAQNVYNNSGVWSIDDSCVSSIKLSFYANIVFDLLIFWSWVGIIILAIFS